MSVSRNSSFKGSNNVDNSCNAWGAKEKVYYQYKTNYKNNAPGPHISDTASSFCPSLPSLHEEETLNKIAMNFFQDCIGQFPAWALGALHEITEQILNVPLNTNQSQPFIVYPHPNIDILQPILCHMGFSYMDNADSSGKRPLILQNRNKAMRAIVFVADTLKQRLKVTNNKNKHNDTNNHSIRSESDFGGSSYSYSSSGFNESQLTAIEVQMSFKGAIEVQIEGNWLFLRPKGTSNAMPRDGTYSFVQIDEEIKVEVAYQSTSRTASLSALFRLDLIRIPNKNHQWLQLKQLF